MSKVSPIILRFIWIIFIFALSASTSAAAEPGFTGLQVQGITAEIAKALGQTKNKGVLVRDIELGGPAAVAGFERSDLIVKFAGVAIDSFKSLLSAVGSVHPGQNVAVVVMRRGSSVKLTIKASKRPKSRSIVKGSFATIPGVGLTLASITEKVRKTFGLRWSTTGVVVTIVDEAKAKGSDLKRGEVIVQVNQEYVWTPSQVVARYLKAKAKGAKSMLLLVEGNTGRRNGFHFSPLPVR